MLWNVNNFIQLSVKYVHEILSEHYNPVLISEHGGGDQEEEQEEFAGEYIFNLEEQIKECKQLYVVCMGGCIMDNFRPLKRTLFYPNVKFINFIKN